MTIAANLVMELRERTGAGIMECKSALQKANGNIDEAVEIMRKAGQAKADKKASRVAAEGVIVIKVNAERTLAVMLEINCETDFVARDTNFTQFAEEVASVALTQRCHDIQKLTALKMADTTVEEARQALIIKIGENISLRRLQLIEGALLASYLHGSRIGVVVAAEGGNATIAHDIAMHIAASNPVAITEQDVSPVVLEKERDIARAQAETSGKPANIIEKMVEGRIKKYLEEVTLVGQAFVKNPEITISQLLKQNSMKVTQFYRFEVGQGIEKQTTDFVKEVMSQVQGS